EALEESWIHHVERGEARSSDSGKIRRPVERGRERLEFGKRHLMMDVVRHAALDRPHRRLGERNLDAKRRGGLFLGLARIVAEQSENMFEVLAIVGALAREIVGEIIVAVG